MKFGVVGLGNQAVNRVMPEIPKGGNAVTAVYSRDMRKAREIGAGYSAQGYNKLEKFFGGDFDAVYIASPNFLHYKQAKMALEHGKHVLLEKPMTLKEKHAIELIRIAKEKGLALAIGFHMRFHPAIAEVKGLIESGKLGEISYIAGDWSVFWDVPPSEPDTKWRVEDDKVGGGPMMGMGVHVIDSINYILGRKPEAVCAVRVPSGSIVETSEVVNLSYGKTMASCLCSRRIKNPQNSLTVYGDKGTAVGKGIFGSKIAGELVLSSGMESRQAGYESGSIFGSEIADFVNFVGKRDSRIAGGEDGHELVRIVNAAYMSDLKKRIVKLD